jgi:hypothetical protein
MKAKQILRLMVVVVGAAIVKAIWNPTPSPWMTLIIWIAVIAGLGGWFISYIMKGYRSDEKGSGKK